MLWTTIAAVRNKLISSVLTEVCCLFPPRTNAAQREYEVQKKTHWCLKEPISVREEEAAAAAVGEEMLSRRQTTLRRPKNIFASETKKRTQHVKLCYLTCRCDGGLWGRLMQSLKMQKLFIYLFVFPPIQAALLNFRDLPFPDESENRLML